MRETALGVAASLIILASNVMAEQPQGGYILLPLPAHVASQMQAAAEQRAKDVEAGGGTVWGTAQADMMIAKLRAIGALPPESAASTPIPPASAASSPAPALLIAHDLDENALRALVVSFYASMPEHLRQEAALAFRKDARRVMYDALIALSSTYSIGRGRDVDWNELASNVETMLAAHPAKISDIFKDAINASARTGQKP